MANNTVFISYSRENTDFMRGLKSRLEEAGIKVWVDENIKGGTTWDNIIEEALASSDTIIVVLSEASVASRMVMNEVSYGIEENRRVIPVMVEQCKVPFRLRRIQYIDFTGEFDAGMKGLLTALDREDTIAPKADPIVAPSQSTGPKVITEGETPKTAANMAATPTQTEKTKKGMPKWIYAVLGLVILAIVVPFLLPSDEDDNTTSEDYSSKSKIAEKGDFTQDVIQQDPVKIVNDSSAISPPEPLSPQEKEWEYAKKQNTIVSYTSYLLVYPVDREQQEEADGYLKALFEKEGFIQYSQSNGASYFKKSYSTTMVGDPLEGDIIRLLSDRSIKGGSYGTAGFDQTLKVGKKGEKMYVKQVIPSGKALWVKVGYNE